MPKKTRESEPASAANALETPSEELIPRSYHRGGSQRFEMFLPPDLVADLQLMKRKTGNSFAAYIRRSVERALEEDKPRWQKER